MANNIYKAVVLLGVFALASLPTSAREWSMTLQVKKREFKEATFMSQSLLNSAFAGLPGGDQYITFALDPNDPGNWQVVSTQEPGQVINPPNDGEQASIFADQASWNGGKEKDEDADGLTISVSTPLSAAERRHIELSLGLSYFSFDSESDATASPGSTAGFSTSASEFIIPAPTPPGYTVSNTATFDVLVPPTITNNVLNHSNISVNSDVDVDLFVFDAEVTGTFPITDFIDLKIGAGPTLNIAAVDSHFSHITQVGQTGDFARDTIDDNETDILIGAQGAATLLFRFKETIRLGVSYRYDLMFDDVKTDVVEVDLSGQNFGLELTIDF